MMLCGNFRLPNPFHKAWRWNVFRKILYGDHAYGTVFPTEGSINKTTVADIKNYYASNFGAARAHLYVAGRFDAGEMKKAVTTAFGGWSKGALPLINRPTVKPQHVLDVSDRPGAAQSTLIVGMPVPNPTSRMRFRWR